MSRMRRRAVQGRMSIRQDSRGGFVLLDRSWVMKSARRKAIRPKRAGFKRILLTTGFSEFSRRTFDIAVQFARVFQSHLTLLHVVPEVLPADISHVGLVFTLKKQVEKANSQLMELRQTKLPRDLKVKTVLLEGGVVHEIVKYAREFHVDLIVMATHGYSGLKHFWLGSIAENVLRRAPCPVLVVPSCMIDQIAVSEKRRNSGQRSVSATARTGPD